MQDNQMSDWQRRFEERGLKFEEAAVERRLLSNAVNSVEAGDFGAPLPTLEMTGGGAFRMKMTKRSVNGKILFPKLWKIKSFGNRIFT